ncbi:MAG TPA: hypothetical protein VJZ03_04235 [Candidatus Bathyarchaeia archaeon]|nr:hypothetical protein [Candidatus Bathyarchaeia archaeon]
MAINWSDKAANPEAFGDVEKALYVEIEPILKNLLQELRDNQKIRTRYSQTDMDNLRGVIDRYKVASDVYNFTLGAAKAPDITLRFLKATAEFGLTESTSVGIWLQAGLFVDIVSTELSKLIILFYLKDVDYTVSHFSRTMAQHAPPTWPKLKQYVDNEFRNAIAHCTLAVRDKKVILYKDATLTQILEDMEVYEFMMRVKRENVLFICVFNVLAELKKQGWFT